MANEDNDDDFNGKPYEIYSKAVAHEHDIYLSDHVGNDAGEYVGLYNFFMNAKDTDWINLHIANFGGACHTGLRLAHAIKHCKAQVIIYVTAPCYSMGAILAVSGTAMQMMPGTFLMFHNYSTVESGKSGEVQAAVNEYNVHFHESLQHFCSPFLTPSEIQALKEDQDVYIHADGRVRVGAKTTNKAGKQGLNALKKRLKRQFPRAEIL